MDNIKFDYIGLVNEVVQRNIHLADGRDEWVRLAMSLADLGEDGRRLFHQLSSLSTDVYNERENDAMFNDALLHRQKITIASFIQMCKEHNVDVCKYAHGSRAEFIEQPKKTSQVPHGIAEISTIPYEYVRASQSLHSNLVAFLSMLFPITDVKRVVEAYHLGATRTFDTIYWQIDNKFRVRTGKVMKYDAMSGHRVKDEATPHKVNWIHSILLKRGELPSNWKNAMHQCLFGEHLLSLPENRHRTIAIVEAEKTALVGSLLMPDYIWLAVGGEGMFTSARLNVLTGRNVIAYPDAHPNGASYKRWCDVSKQCTFCRSIEVSDYLERSASSEQKERKIDIADVLIDARLVDMDADSKLLIELFTQRPVLLGIVQQLDLEV